MARRERRGAPGGALDDRVRGPFTSAVARRSIDGERQTRPTEGSLRCRSTSRVETSRSPTSIRTHAERRLDKVARQVSDLARLEIEIFKEPQPAGRRLPRRRGHAVPEGRDAARARRLARDAALAEPDGRRAGAPGQAPPRQTAPPPRGARARPPATQAARGGAAGAAVAQRVDARARPSARPASPARAFAGVSVGSTQHARVVSCAGVTSRAGSRSRDEAVRASRAVVGVARARACCWPRARRRGVSPLAAAARRHARRGRARRSSTQPLAQRAAARKRAAARSGTPRRSSSPARAPTARASSSTRATSTTTTAPRRSPTRPTRCISPGGDASGGDLFSAPDGTYDYPTGPGYDENAANLVELRVKPLRDGDGVPDHAEHAREPEPRRDRDRDRRHRRRNPPVPVRRQRERAGAVLPDGPRRNGGAHRRRDRRDGARARRRRVSVDLARRQITVEVPHSEWNPGTSTVRLAAGVGLWNDATGQLPAAGRRRAARRSPAAPGATASPPAFFDVAFRFNAQEPVPGTPEPEQRRPNPAWWRESAQAQALAERRHQPVPRRSRLRQAAGESRTTTCPASRPACRRAGAFDRILASHFSDGQGADYATGGCGSSSACIGAMRGQLLPYAIYVPSGADTGRRLGPDAAAALAVGQLQPVRGLAEPVAVRRARRRLDRDHALRARARTAGTTTTPAPTRSKCGPTSPRTTS